MIWIKIAEKEYRDTALYIEYEKKGVLAHRGIDIIMNKSNTISMKTAISIPDDLFEQVNKLAKENKTSRSQIFCAAVEAYLEKVKSHKLLEALNSAYADEETSEEKLLRIKSTEYFESTILKKKNEDQTG